MQINRLFEIIYLLLDKKTMTAGEIARHFEVSTRTVYRDVETLSQAGIPIYASKGIGGGIRLTDNFVLNKSVLSAEEQRSILSSLHGMNAVRTDEVKPVLEKLSALFGGEQEDWIEIDFSSWNPHNPISRRFEALKDAIFTRHVVEFVYSSASGATEKRRTEPMKLIFRGYDWYLLSWCRLREDFRFFKLSRMDDIRVTEENFTRRPMTVSDRPNASYTANMVRLKVLIKSEMMYRAREEFDHNQMEPQPDGGFLVQFEMPDNEWLYEYLLTYGAGMQVLEPWEVRQELCRRLKFTLAQYEI